MSKITIISSSLREKSTSRTLLDEVLRGLEENNHILSVIDLRNIHMEFCKGCLSCQKTNRCFIKDDIDGIIDFVNSSDIILFASPIYYYSISGQLKTFLDRMNPLYGREDRKFNKVYALFTCADDVETAIEGPKKAIEGWASCFEGVDYVDSFLGKELNTVNDIDKDILKAAYEFGKSIK